MFNEMGGMRGTGAPPVAPRRKRPHSGHRNLYRSTSAPPSRRTPIVRCGQPTPVTTVSRMTLTRVRWRCADGGGGQSELPAPARLRPCP